MFHGASCPGGHWCSRVDALFDVDGIHVTSVVRTRNGLLLHVESDQTLNGCPACGVVAVGHGRRPVRLHDVPAFGKPVRLVWAKRVWRCPEPDCPTGTFTETHPLARTKAKLTTCAVAWATDALERFDQSVSALAHQFGISWHTAWDAIRPEAERRSSSTDRFQGINALGVDEHKWSHAGPPGTGNPRFPRKFSAPR